jgi:H+/gluconate symporter-like permease
VTDNFATPSWLGNRCRDSHFNGSVFWVVNLMMGITEIRNIVG